MIYAGVEEALSLPCDVQQNSVSFTHILCKTTASLRATAMRALRKPFLRASFNPHAFKALHFLPIKSVVAA